ncbi:hypothetical protein BARBAKC583_0978 [Bartonella bacilliformis KC583]|uniref:Uncharacterized protein n=1 Tax=Bartonella bacilliformis (strain ATCC 35685 / KC583 / Herrer 020/F12,63) TaxID=360095 RepID=A1UTF5_BARBK|nr:hypothetical protein BARBAKC583_0978 [Bartonella bacilliformis KC583]
MCSLHSLHSIDINVGTLGETKIPKMMIEDFHSKLLQKR